MQVLLNQPPLFEGAGLQSGALFSDCRTWRYKLWRIWDATLPYLQFICLNPSVADAYRNDRTLVRCINYAKSFSFGGVFMTNAFAFVTPDPEEMKRAADPIGPENDYWLKEVSRDAGMVIAGWGLDGMFMGRAEQVMKLIPKVHYLKLSKDGYPCHPLYLNKDLRPQLYVN
jgi:hypothetical protein